MSVALQNSLLFNYLQEFNSCSGVNSECGIGHPTADMYGCGYSSASLSDMEVGMDYVVWPSTDVSVDINDGDFNYREFFGLEEHVFSEVPCSNIQPGSLEDIDYEDHYLEDVSCVYPSSTINPGSMEDIDYEDHYAIISVLSELKSAENGSSSESKHQDELFTTVGDISEVDVSDVHAPSIPSTTVLLDEDTGLANFQPPSIDNNQDLLESYNSCLQDHSALKLGLYDNLEEVSSNMAIDSTILDPKITDGAVQNKQEESQSLGESLESEVSFEMEAKSKEEDYTSSKFLNDKCDVVLAKRSTILDMTESFLCGAIKLDSDYTEINWSFNDHIGQVQLLTMNNFEKITLNSEMILYKIWERWKSILVFDILVKLRSYIVDRLVGRVKSVIAGGVSSVDTGAYGHDIGISLPILLNAIAKEFLAKEFLPDGSSMLRIGMTNLPSILYEVVSAIAKLPSVRRWSVFGEEIQPFPQINDKAALGKERPSEEKCFPNSKISVTGHCNYIEYDSCFVNSSVSIDKKRSWFSGLRLEAITFDPGGRHAVFCTEIPEYFITELAPSGSICSSFCFLVPA